MKKLLILLFAPVFCGSFRALPRVGGTDAYIYCRGEYFSMVIDIYSHHFYDLSNGIPTFQAVPNNVIGGSAGSHGECVIDSAGNVWCKGLNAYGEMGPAHVGGSINTFTKILLDSSGRAFTNIVQLSSAYQVTMAVKGDGTLWIFGNASNGLRGDYSTGTVHCPAPVQIVLPYGQLAAKVICTSGLWICITTTGKVLNCGYDASYESPWNLGRGTASPNYYYPDSVRIGGIAVQIAAGQYYMNYALLNTGILKGWGEIPGYLGAKVANAGFGYSPVALNSYLNLPYRIDTIVCSAVSTEVKLTDGSIWAWGDASMGIGNGVQLNYMTLAYGGIPQPYEWNFSCCQLLVSTPFNIAPGYKNWNHIYSSASLEFGFTMTTGGDSIAVVGRNKSDEAMNRIIGGAPTIGHIADTLPDSWNLVYATFIDPPGLSTQLIQQTSPYCLLHPTKGPCNTFVDPVAPAPSARGNNQILPLGTTAASANFTASAATGYVITAHFVTVVSSPGSPLIMFPASGRTIVNGLSNGLTILRDSVTDQNLRTALAYDTLTVSLNPNIPNSNSHRRRYRYKHT